MVCFLVEGTKKRKKLAIGESLQRGSAAGIDLISNLPEDVINLILGRLQIRDAVRMSILSKEWRYKWVSMPNLVFDNYLLIRNATASSKTETVCAHIVDQLLPQVIGPISKVSLLSFSALSSHHIDHWIMFLSTRNWNCNGKNGIKEFILDNVNRRKINFWYSVHSSIFLCQELGRLQLWYCSLEVPPTFKGFQSLLVLNLFARISGDDIERLISGCPLLESLRFRACDFYQHLNIHGPNLRYLYLHGEFRHLSIQTASPLLTNATLRSDVTPHWRMGGGGPCSSIRFIGCLHGIKRLALEKFFLQYLCIDIVPEKLSATLDHIEYLEVDIAFNSKEILAILCILRSSPNLKELKIKYYADGEGKRDVLWGERDEISGEQAKLWARKTQFDHFLSHLHAVEMIGLAVLSDLEFIRCILSNAPLLETMKIYTNKYVEDEKVSMILTELLQYQRASTRSEIIYLGHYKGS